MNRICCVYKITNPQSMVYVGQSVNVNARFNSYRNLHCKSQPLIYGSLLEFGADSHSYEVIELCEKESLNERERFWQEHYTSMGKSLNLDLQRTNDKRVIRSQSTKDKISKMNTGHSHNKGFKKTQEAIEKSRAWHIGSKRNENSKENMRNSASYKSKPVIQYDLEMNYINEFRSSHEASRQTGAKRPHINDCCKGKYKSTGGFKWAYKN